MSPSSTGTPSPSTTPPSFWNPAPSPLCWAPPARASRRWPLSSHASPTRTPAPYASVAWICGTWTSPPCTPRSPSSSRTPSCSAPPCGRTSRSDAPTPIWSRCATLPAWPTSTRRSWPCRRVTTPSWGRTRLCPVGRSSASPLRVPSCWTPPSSCLTRPLPWPTRSRRPRSRRRSVPWSRTEPSWSSLIVRPPCAVPTASSSWSAGASSPLAATTIWSTSPTTAPFCVRAASSAMSPPWPVRDPSPRRTVPLGQVPDRRRSLPPLSARTPAWKPTVHGPFPRC